MLFFFTVVMCSLCNVLNCKQLQDFKEEMLKMVKCLVYRSWVAVWLYVGTATRKIYLLVNLLWKKMKDFMKQIRKCLKSN